MSDFWITFIGGLASGVVLIVLTTLIRRLLRRRAKGEATRLNLKGLRPLGAIAIGFALIFIDIFMINDGGFITGIGGMILIMERYGISLLVRN